jgi:DNA-binding NarL/FixJ family response regulator
MNAIQDPSRRLRTVLLIDDDPGFVWDVRRIINESDRLDWLSGTENALDLIRSAAPGVILLDLHMPRHLANLDEDEGLALLKHLSPEEQARVIVVTRALSDSTLETLGRLGVKRVYHKSESIARLAALMEQ